jgi:hypothetical protein
MTVSTPLVYQPPPPEKPDKDYVIRLPPNLEPSLEAASEPRPGLMARVDYIYA